MQIRPSTLLQRQCSICVRDCKVIKKAAKIYVELYTKEHAVLEGSLGREKQIFAWAEQEERKLETVKFEEAQHENPAFH